MVLGIIVGIIVTVLSLKFLMTGSPNKINGVYCQPGRFFWIKYCVFLMILKLRQRQNQKSLNKSKNAAGYGMKSRNSIKEMDRVQKLPENELKVNFFYSLSVYCSVLYVYREGKAIRP